jgi:hypothetical protein
MLQYEIKNLVFPMSLMSSENNPKISDRNIQLFDSSGLITR